MNRCDSKQQPDSALMVSKETCSPQPTTQKQPTSTAESDHDMFEKILTSISLRSSASSEHLESQFNSCNLVSSVFLVPILMNKLLWTIYLCNLPVCSRSNGSGSIHHSQCLPSRIQLPLVAVGRVSLLFPIILGYSLD